MNEWRSTEHAAAYLERADRVPHRAEGEAVLLAELPATVRRILDLGSGDGRLLDLVLCARPAARGVALDFSPLMLSRLNARFPQETGVDVVEHNLDATLPALGTFDVVVSSFAIHHLVAARQRALYGEVFARLEPGGMLANLEHVDSPTPELHAAFLRALGKDPADDDPSNQLVAVSTQLEWLRSIGFEQVDCMWKWREIALLVGAKARRT